MKKVLLCINKERHNFSLKVGSIYFDYETASVDTQYMIHDESLAGSYLKSKFIEIPYTKLIRLLFE